jgi:hypothetical protein
MPAVAVADRVAALRSRNPSKGRAVAVLRFRGWKAERAGVRDWADYPGGWWRPEPRQRSRFRTPAGDWPRSPARGRIAHPPATASPA